MLIKKIEIERLRCVLSDSIDCENMTALVGRNGAGKSCFLYALRLLYTVAPPVTLEDFYNRDPNHPIQIQVVFGELLPAELGVFGAYVHGSTLTVTKQISWEAGKPVARTYGTSLQHPKFIAIRALDGKQKKKDAFNELCGQGEFTALRAVTRADDAEPQMKEWEIANAALCTATKREEQLLGPASIGVGSLDTSTKFVFVPAVRDVTAETADGKSSALGALLQLVVNERVQSREDLKTLRETLKTQYKEIFSAGEQAELRGLAEDVSRLLSSYHPRSSVSLSWKPGPAPELPMPPVETALSEDGFMGEVTRKGHGLQRAMILALLQARAESRDAAAEAPKRSLILAIEEPELYQHPLQCRHWTKVLRKITSASGTQVIFTTHSPHFVDLAWFDQVRAVRKIAGANGAPAKTKTQAAALQQVAEDLAAASGRPAAEFSAETTRARARSVMTTHVNEGFFADVVVLVEGGTEVGILQELAHRLGVDWEAKGVAVIDVGGKSKLDRPLAIFRRMGIPVYLLFDGDAGNTRDAEKMKQQNRHLLRLMGTAGVDYPETDAHDRYAVMRDTTETELKEILTRDVYDEISKACAIELGYTAPSEAMKNVEVAAHFAGKVYDAGKTLPVFERIVGKITALAPAL